MVVNTRCVRPSICVTSAKLQKYKYNPKLSFWWVVLTVNATTKSALTKTRPNYVVAAPSISQALAALQQTY